MNKMFQESELILRPDGSVYHLNLFPEELADTILLVGDPGRVPKISKYFDQIEVRKQNREITTHTGYFNKKRLTVMSTGIGTDNIDICVNELDMLVNIDLKKRVLRDKIKKLNIIRLGTSGGLRADIPLDSFVVSSHGIGLDVVMGYYKRDLSAEEVAMANAFVKHLGEDADNLRPYIAEGSRNLIDLFKDVCIEGVTVTGAGFYAPQGRILRYQLAMPKLIDKLSAFRYKNYRITNFEMETSAIYGLGHKILGHNCCSLNLIIANRQEKTFTTKADESMEKMIQMALERLTKR